MTKRRDLLIGSDEKHDAKRPNLELEVLTALKKPLQFVSKRKIINLVKYLKSYYLILKKIMFSFEQQLGLIDKIGSQNHHQSQMGE